MQPKLLRALEESKVRPVGSETEVAFDVRHSGRHQSRPGDRGGRGAFPQDLFFRINVIQMDLPPLRARGADALLLAQHFIALCAARAKKQVPGISDGRGRKASWPTPGRATSASCAT